MITSKAISYEKVSRGHCFGRYFGVIGIAVACTDIEMPHTVKDAFLAKFPDAEKAEWEMESDDEYEAEFKWQRKEWNVGYRIEWD